MLVHCCSPVSLGRVHRAKHVCGTHVCVYFVHLYSMGTLANRSCSCHTGRVMPTGHGWCKKLELCQSMKCIHHASISGKPDNNSNNKCSIDSKVVHNKTVKINQYFSGHVSSETFLAHAHSCSLASFHWTAEHVIYLASNGSIHVDEVAVSLN